MDVDRDDLGPADDRADQPLARGGSELFGALGRTGAVVGPTGEAMDHWGTGVTCYATGVHGGDVSVVFSDGVHVRKSIQSHTATKFFRDVGDHVHEGGVRITSTTEVSCTINIQTRTGEMVATYDATPARDRVVITQAVHKVANFIGEQWLYNPGPDPVTVGVFDGKTRLHTVHLGTGGQDRQAELPDEIFDKQSFNRALDLRAGDGENFVAMSVMRIGETKGSLLASAGLPMGEQAGSYVQYVPRLLNNYGGQDQHSGISVVNVGDVATEIEIDLRMVDPTSGLLYTQTIASRDPVAPGTSWGTYVDNGLLDWDGSTFGSALIRSKDAPIVATINEDRRSGRQRGGSYTTIAEPQRNVVFTQFPHVTRSGGGATWVGEIQLADASGLGTRCQMRFAPDPPLLQPPTYQFEIPAHGSKVVRGDDPAGGSTRVPLGYNSSANVLCDRPVTGVFTMAHTGSPEDPHHPNHHDDSDASVTTGLHLSTIEPYVGLEDSGTVCSTLTEALELTEDTRKMSIILGVLGNIDLLNGWVSDSSTIGGVEHVWDLYNHQTTVAAWTGHEASVGLEWNIASTSAEAYFAVASGLDEVADWYGPFASIGVTAEVGPASNLATQLALGFGVSATGGTSTFINRKDLDGDGTLELLDPTHPDAVWGASAAVGLSASWGAGFWIPTGTPLAVTGEINFVEGGSGQHAVAIRSAYEWLARRGGLFIPLDVNLVDVDSGNDCLALDPQWGEDPETAEAMQCVLEFGEPGDSHIYRSTIQGLAMCRMYGAQQCLGPVGALVLATLNGLATIRDTQNGLDAICNG